MNVRTRSIRKRRMMQSEPRGLDPKARQRLTCQQDRHQLLQLSALVLYNVRAPVETTLLELPSK